MSLAPYLTFSPSVQPFANQPVLRRLINHAIDRAIREILPPVVERSVTIASIAAKELVTKDFALEGDELKMRKASHLMVQSLAGSLASVTCREPLRISIIQHFRTLLAQNGYSEQSIPDHILQTVINDNLDLACSILEKTAAEKSIAEIDEILGPAFIARKRHREVSLWFFLFLATYRSTLL
jgi:CCR4-NOT transcription complex subunit 1